MHFHFWRILENLAVNRLSAMMPHCATMSYNRNHRVRILDMVRVPEARSNFCCTWQRWAAYHPKSDSNRWVELKWTRIKLELVKNIPFSHPRREEMKIIEVSSWEKFWNLLDLVNYKYFILNMFHFYFLIARISSNSRILFVHIFLQPILKKPLIWCFCI